MHDPHVSARVSRILTPALGRRVQGSSMPIKLAENFRAVFYAPFYAAQALGFYVQ
jgi:hypothetical protein